MLDIEKEFLKNTAVLEQRGLRIIVKTQCIRCGKIFELNDLEESLTHIKNCKIIEDLNNV